MAQASTPGFPWIWLPLAKLAPSIRILASFCWTFVHLEKVWISGFKKVLEIDTIHVTMCHVLMWKDWSRHVKVDCLIFFSASLAHLSFTMSSKKMVIVGNIGPTLSCFRFFLHYHYVQVTVVRNPLAPPWPSNRPGYCTRYPRFADQPPTSSQTWDQSSRGIKLLGPMIHLTIFPP